MKKKFSELNKTTYKIAVEFHILKRHVGDFFKSYKFSKSFSQDDCTHCISHHQSKVLRGLRGVDMILQKNKIKNLSLAIKRLDGVMIKPGEVFSFYKLVGRTSEREGYLDGLMIKGGKVSKGVGGGLCQMTNMIHYLVLHSPLTILEYHNHNSFDLFPDDGRKVPFGIGTSITYNYLDYRFKNNTSDTYQLKFWIEEGYLKGQLRSTCDNKNTYKLHEENHYFSLVGGMTYRHNEVYLITSDNENGLVKELISSCKAKVMYEIDLEMDKENKNVYHKRSD